jgi:peptide deformylase
MLEAQMKVDLAYLGHPILRKKARPVLTIDQPILDLVQHLKATVVAHRGLGLAAPQIGAQVAILVACFPEWSEQDAIVPGAPKVFINPKISDPSAEMWSEEEGCLSIPKVYASVERPRSITVTYQDEQGAAHTERLVGWPAKIVMHENDHLNGVLFIDRLEAGAKREIAADLDRLKKHYKISNEHLRIWGGVGQL